MALKLVYDSGSQLELISAANLTEIFNSEGTPSTLDQRSDNKGPEPEGVAIGRCPNSRTRPSSVR